MSRTTRLAAGAQFDKAMEVERAVRDAWRRMVALWPGTAATRESIRLTCRRAASLLEGRDSRLARAARTQPFPWWLDTEPIAGAIHQAMDITRRANDLERVVADSTDLQTRFEILKSRFAVELPTTWRRSVDSRGITAQSIDRARTGAELHLLRQLLMRGERELTRRRMEMEAWIAGRAGDPPKNQDASLPWAILEERYDVLVALGAIDRVPIQHRIAAELRAIILDHLQFLRMDKPRQVGGVVLTVAKQFASSRSASRFSAEELAAYTAATLASGASTRTTPRA
jgi:hypothetical protein